MRNKGNLETTTPMRITTTKGQMTKKAEERSGLGKGAISDLNKEESTEVIINPSKGKGEVQDPTYCEPSRALPRLRSGGSSKYLRMGALVTPRVEGGLI